ncbi:testis-specific Y-encoded-like protein 1 [Otolemur garnettii]|uniref:TSPY like 1 n=1 Tax=Otolemur garnettii TaxID=30611 RepID=H0WI29_OTOGA|nr:testis-specific Y-encoded-like protein 1 [Otolemur garnettii]
MSSLDGVERTPLPQTHSLTIFDGAPREPDPHQYLRLRDETEETQVMAETGEGSLAAVALPPPQLSEAGVPRDPAHCVYIPGVRVGEGGGHVAIRAGQEETPPPTEGLEAATDTITNGFQWQEKALKSCGAEGSWSEAMAGPKGEDVKSGKCATLPAVGGEQRAAPSEEAAAAAAAEDAMEVEQKPVGEEVEAVEENRVVEEVKEEAGPWPLNAALRMDPLEAIQLELDTVNAQADRAFQQLEHKFGRMRRHYLERRNYIIQNIPGFWMTAFRNHPQLSPMIRGQDAEMLRYITNLEVKELRHPRTGCKFKFFFRRNPYFRNKLIVKEYEVRSSGRVVSLSTPIIWRRGHEPQSFIRRNQDLVCSFFTWFSDHSLPESDKIAEIIKEDLWPNPLQYYLLREGVRRARRRPIREPVEIPRPFGFQSG